MIESLRDYIELLVKKDLLISIPDHVRREDLPEIIEKLLIKNKTLFFQHVEGYNVRVISNLVPSQKVFSYLFEGEKDPYFAFVQRAGKLIKKTLIKKEKGYSSINVKENDDLLNFLPILKHYKKDSAPYITTALVSSMDPETKVVGRGIHRMEYRGKNRFGISLINPPLADILKKYRNLKKNMPISISLGVDPLLFLSMALKVQNDVDKIEVAGAIKGRSVKVMRSFDSPIDVPAGTEFLLEGEVHIEEKRKDGPLGEISGYYMTIEETPTVHIRKISFRKNPIYHALLPTSPEADMYLTFVSRAHVERDVKKLFPFVEEVIFLERTFGSSVIITTTPTERFKINNLLHFVLSFPMIKKAIVVDTDIDANDLKDLEWAIVTRCFAKDDLILLRSMQGQPIDPEAMDGQGVTKIGINATTYGKNLEERAQIAPGDKNRVMKVIKKYAAQ
ncbi:MAG: UbiD family decarboxylase [Deltaproteobacteria bacterium]|nr:UbiD family decarboxylase [Deltaproteobacteria bacterium]